VVKHLGHIQGLPEKFTVNGAVVNHEGHLLVSSAVYGNAYYVVNPESWEASLYRNDGSVFRSSDLANSNFLTRSSKNPTIETIVKRDPSMNAISVYPNPVVNNNFTMQFRKIPAGEYTMELTDVLGRSVLQQRITVISEDQTKVINLKPGSTKGVYLVKLADHSNKAVFEQKILIQ
jgi:hypothetical protein